MPEEVFTELQQIKVAVLGLGHVGLPTALGLAELGWDVIGADTDSNKVQTLKAGKCPFHEPELQGLLTKHLANPRFAVSNDIGATIRSSTILFVCVGTPQSHDGQADMTCVEELARIIATNLSGYKLIVEKSTVPAITGQWIRRTVLQHAQAHNVRADRNGKPNGGNSGTTAWPASLPAFEVASNPEFLREGLAVQDFFSPDRIVCGVSSGRAKAILAELYRGLACPILFTDLTTAELIKYAANAYLATKISFINMVADVCEAVGADVTQVATGLGLDRRIGSQFLEAGLGFGGYCLPKDLRAFVHLADENKVDCSLLKEAEKINNLRVERLLRKVHEKLWVLRGKKIGVLGLAFKADTDDVRDAPSFKVIHRLLSEGAKLKLYDPKALKNAKAAFPELLKDCTLFGSAYDAASGTDALLILTNWAEFKHLDLPRLRSLMHIPIIVDGRNLLDPETVRMAGFEYACMGRAIQSPNHLLAVTETSGSATHKDWLDFPFVVPAVFSRTKQRHEGQKRGTADLQSRRREHTGDSV